MGYEAFEKLCKEKGVKPFTVSQQTGISTATLSSWKTGRYKPKSDKLQILADYFDVPLEAFTSDTYDARIDNNNRLLRKYYSSEETSDVAQQMFDDKQLRALFHVKQNVDAVKFQAYYDALIALYRAEHKDDSYDFDSEKPTE
jgi:transcriptional regulator with XRE-family HTH domain